MKNLTAFYKLLSTPFFFLTARIKDIITTSLQLSKLSVVFISIIFSTSLYAVEIANDTFDNSSLDGWSGTDVSSSGGFLVIERDRTGTKTYNFGASYANQTLTIEFSAVVPNAWEDNTQNNTDYFNVLVNGSVVQTYFSSGGTINQTFTATADSSGSITLGFNPDTTSDNEFAEIDWITIDSDTGLVADAGADQNIIEGEDVILDGSGSTDDGTITDYSWSVDGSTYSGVNPTISGLTAGVYIATLTVTDNDNNTDTDTMEITVVSAPSNQDPVADAGVDQTIIEGNNVQLDGSGSTDDGTITDYSWEVNGVTYTEVSPTISGLTVGTYTATLTVTDNNGATDTDTMQITVTSIPTNFTCANPRSYTQAFYANMTAEIDIIGNSVVCQNDGSGQCSDPGNTRNNNINMMYINEDGDSSTFNHSSAELNLPADSTIVWAGLYWQGMFAGPTSTQQNNSKTIKLKVPGGNYVDLTSEDSKFNWVYLKETPNRWMYQGVVEITGLIDVNDPNGYYSVANLHTQEGTPAGGSFGAWSIVLVYENSDLPVQNVTVYDGYQGIMPGGNGATCSDRSGDPQKACEYAQDNGCSIDLAATGVANPVSVTLSGFLTPSSGTVNSKLALFSGEGDRAVTGDRMSITDKSGVASYISDAQNPENDVQNATISKNGLQVTTLEPQATLAGGTPWVNTLGADIDLFDITDMLDNDQSLTTVTMNTSGDGYFPGVFAFSTELYSPSLCYDYSYKQNEQFFTEENNGSFEPRIVGDGLSISDDVTVEFFIQNTEASDVVIDNMTVSIVDINTTQAEYVPNSTYIVYPNEVFPVLNTDTNFGTSFNSDIPIGTLDSQDFFYVDYDLDIKNSSIDMPLNVKLNYNLQLPGLNIPLETYLGNDMPLCNDDNFAYKPIYGNFNVENAILSQSQRYNLPTQTANRAGDFVVTAYDVTNVHQRIGISTPVAIELIDAGKYHSVDASCREPDSALTPRVWVIFDNNVSVIPFDAETLTNAIANGTISDQISGGSTPISTPGEFYGRATENAAFRIGFNRAGDGDEIIQLASGTCTGQQVPPCVEVLNFPDLSQVDLDGDGPLNAGECIQDIDGNPTNTDKIPQNCGNAGTAGMDSVQLAVCMECIYGYNIDYRCSRDNFAIRPESFRMDLKDQDQSDNTLQSDITVNNDTTLTHAAGNPHHLVAGYAYDLEINATNYQNDNTTPGYYASYLLDGDGGDRSIKLNWEPSADDTKCNDTEDQNQTTTFFNGATALDLKSAQIGKYNLTLLDRRWTRVDHDPAYMSHHTTGDGAGYFITTANSDCIDSSSVVPVENAYTLTYAEDISGCDITTAYNDPANDSLTYHQNINTSSDYTDIALRIHPYAFDHSGLSATAGISDKNFIYINTPDADDKNMTYNMNGIFRAVGYDGGHLSNFVYQCYAEDVNMTLYLQYQHANPADSEPFLSYDLVDINTNDPSQPHIRPRPTTSAGEPTYRFSTTGPLSITQDDDYFVKDLNGSIDMDLGYNFKRNYNERMNPRFIQMNDFNITYISSPTGIKADLKSDFVIFGNKTLDRNITFMYGRAKPAKFFYEDIIDPSVFTPVSVVAYCDLGFTECQNRGIMAAFAGTNEPYWWLSVDHRTIDNDGDIILQTGTPTEGSGTPTVTSAVNITTSEATDHSVQVVSNATQLPMTVPINFVTDTNLTNFTDDWVIYNEYDNSVPSPFYKVRFIGDSNWTGIGDEGMVVGTEASRRKTKRLDW